MAKQSKGFKSTSSKNVMVLLLLVLITIGVAYYVLSNQVGINPFAKSSGGSPEVMFQGASLTSDSAPAQVKQVARDYHFVVNVMCDNGKKLQDTSYVGPYISATNEWTDPQVPYFTRSYVNEGVWWANLNTKDKPQNEDRLFSLRLNNSLEGKLEKPVLPLPKGMFHAKVGAYDDEEVLWALRDVPSGEYTFNYQLPANSFACKKHDKEYKIVAGLYCQNDKYVSHDHQVSIWGAVWPPNPFQSIKTQLEASTNGLLQNTLMLKDTAFGNYNYVGLVTEKGQYLQPLHAYYPEGVLLPQIWHEEFEFGRYFRNNIPLVKWHGEVQAPGTIKIDFQAPVEWCARTRP